MASAGQAHAHSSQPMHFSRPSGQRLSWCRPWKRGAVGSFSKGYCSVTTFLNIVRNVTPKPAIGSQNCSLMLRDSAIGASLRRSLGRGGALGLDQRLAPALEHQRLRGASYRATPGHGRDGEPARDRHGEVLGLCTLRLVGGVADEEEREEQDGK